MCVVEDCSSRVLDFSLIGSIHSIFDIVLNSKGEQIGESLKRKVVSRNIKEVTLLVGDQSR